MNILVIQTGKLGDMVCTTPVFRAIKKKFPHSKLLVMGDQINEEVLRGNPNVDLYVTNSNISSSKIKSLNLDIAILLTPNPSILRALLLAKVKKVISPKVTGGYSPYSTTTYKFLSFFTTRILHRMGYYAPQEYLNMLAPIGIKSSDLRKELYFNNIAEDRIKNLLAPFSSHLKIAIAPGAGNKIKEWPPEKFNQLSQFLIKKYNARIILIGGPKDKVLSEIVKLNLIKNNILDTTGLLPIEDLKALISKMDLFISADTGPIYIAEAFEIPTIDIVGPVDEREQPPRGEKNRIVLPENREKPQLHVMNARVYDIEEAKKLAVSTPVSKVINEVEFLLNHD